MFFIAFHNPLSLFRPFLAINRLAGKRNGLGKAGPGLCLLGWLAIDSLFSAM